MVKYWIYLKYVVRHKWFVMIECFKEGLYWRGLMHDNSKFFPSEFLPYANFFYGRNAKQVAEERKKNKGYYKPTDTGDPKFDFAWLLHQKKNKHHWQWWILPEDEGGLKVLVMPIKYVDEMMCDWIGAGKAQGVGTTTCDWWQANNHKMQLHPWVREYIEERLRQEEKFSKRR